MQMNDLLKMSGSDLDELFKKSPAGKIPSGEGEGRAIIAPGTVMSAPLAEFVQYFAWQGKVFDPEHHVLRNHILPLGIKAIIAEVRLDTSWFDQKECIVLDYSKTSMVAHWIRDEIRAVEPNLYLGLVYWSGKKLIHFALHFQD